MIQRVQENQKKLSKNRILEKISEDALMSYYCPGLKVGRTIYSPFRAESHPSFWVSKRSGKYYYKDLADSRFQGDVWTFIMQMFNVSFYEALQVVNRDFGLGFEGCPEKDYQRMIQELPKHKEKPPSVIEVLHRPFSQRELQWWSRHLQDISDLRREHIFAIKQAKIDGQVWKQTETEMAFGYYYPDADKWKLYYPERKGKLKWRSNISGYYIEKKEQIIGGQKGIITKSLKDRCVLQKLYPYVCSVQNETNAAFGEEFLKFLDENVATKLLAFDNDKGGFKNARLLLKEHYHRGFRHITVPISTGYTDWADWVFNEGPEPTRNYLKQKGLT